jgi:threonine/homoserine/homoserine lactone efflux protein
MNWCAVGLFTAAATALLGSPGPGIAALLAVGRAQGWARGLRYYGGLQMGLGCVVAICGAGLLSLLARYPVMGRALVVGAAIYLVYLAYSIATSPVGEQASARPGAYSALAGLLLGITNPKAYLAISSLLASPLKLSADTGANVGLKAALCIAVIMFVDIVWLWIGVTLGRMKLTHAGERFANIAMGATILVATAFSL